MKTSKKSPAGKIAVAALALLAVLASGLLIFNGLNKSKAGAYTEAKVSQATDSKVIEASGNIESIRQSDLSFASVGLISAVYVNQGQQVRTGEALAALDDSEQRYNYLNAQQKLEQNRLTGNIRQTALAEMELAMQKTALDRAKITAPFAGFISSLNVEPGEYVANGKVAMTLVDRSTLVATLQIDEVDIPLVKIGQRVTFIFDALSGRSLDGKVSQIPPVGKITNQGLAVFDVEAKIDNPPDDLLPGFSFSAQIMVREPKTYLSIPVAALVDIPQDASPSENPADLAGTERTSANPGAPVAPSIPGATATGSAGRPRDAAGRGTRQMPANLSPEQLQAFMTQRKSVNPAAGNQTRPVHLACMVPGVGGKPTLLKFMGMLRSDGTVAVLEGLAEGDIILLPVAPKKASVAKETNSGFRIPGLGGAPGGAPQGGAQPEGTRR